MTQAQVDEYIKCAIDPVYFIQNYIKIVHIDRGLITIDLYDYQENIIRTCHERRRTTTRMCRQSGKTTTISAYILWFILFNENKTVGILANREAMAREILSRIKTAYENLPLWIQQGVLEWNKGSIILENGSRIIASSTSSSAARGFSFSLLYLDEFAFVPNTVADDFMSSVFPTIASGETSKIIISSTPNGMNHFYKLSEDARHDRNGFKELLVTWRQVPGRDQKWADEQIALLGMDKFLQEHECEFLGSAGTLISTVALKALTFTTPILRTLEGLDVYKNPQSRHEYVMVVDTSEGLGQDYSAATVIDITERPYRLVAKYRSNRVSVLMFPEIVVNIGKAYNNAFLLVETNSLGGQVADTIRLDLEYENMFFTEEKQDTTSISARGHARSGVRTSKKVKRIGCATLKSLIESNQLLIDDFNVIDELSTFIAKGGTYKADEGHNDDLVMCLVLFSWMTQQHFFKELTDVDIRKQMYAERLRQLEEESLLVPLSGHDPAAAPEPVYEGGLVWESADN